MSSPSSSRRRCSTSRRWSSSSADRTAGWATWVSDNLVKGDHPIYITTYFLLIVFFAFFYVAISFNPEEVADNMKKYGGFIPGIRAGRPTAEYLSYVLNRITWPGALYLGLIALVPDCRAGAVQRATRTSRSAARAS